MKWVKNPTKDGAYITYVLATDSLGFLQRIKGEWYAKVSQGIVKVENVEGIDRFCKLVRPKE